MSLVALSVVGLALGIAKQLSDVKQDDDRTQKLNAIYAKVVGEQKASQDPKQAALLGSIGQQISDVANHRASNLPNNDFSYSYFDRGNFSRASFRDSLFRDADLAGAVFQNANLSGADLSTAVIDKNTILPKTPPR